MEIVRENIPNFKRGINPKDSLSLGRKFISKTPSGLLKMFQNDLNDKGFLALHVYSWRKNPSSILFQLTKKNYLNLFNNDESELNKFISDWLTKNTYYYLEELERLNITMAEYLYLKIKPDPDSFTWEIHFKKRKNYDK